MKTLMISSLLFMLGGYLVTMNALDTRGNAGSDPISAYNADTVPKKDTLKRKHRDTMMNKKMLDTMHRRKKDSSGVN
jgi:hypothetical protein